MPKLTDYIDYQIIWGDSIHSHYGRLKNGDLVPVTPTYLNEIINMLNIREEVIQIEHEKALKSQPPEPK